LPVNWTRGESNDSGINPSIPAQTFEQHESDRVLASANGRNEEGRRT